MNMDYVQELKESFLNGNRTYVVNEICALPKMVAIAYAAHMADQLSYDGEALATFLRLLENSME